MKWSAVARGSVVLALVLTGAYAVGCSSSDENPSSAGDRIAAEGDGASFCNRLFGVMTSALETCCTSEDKASSEYRFLNGLAGRAGPACTSTLEASIAKKRVRVNPAEAEKCYSAYAAQVGGAGNCKNLTTTYSDPSGDACRRAFSGVQASGAACLGDHECQDGLTCVGYGPSTDGTCLTPPAVNTPCGAARSDGGSVSLTKIRMGTHPACAPGFYCSSTTGTCVARIAEGKPCTFTGEHEREETQCIEPFQCHMGKCGAAGPSSAGGACLDSGDCLDGHYCSGSSGSQPGQCKALEPAGAACKSASFGQCQGRCNTASGSGTCVTFCGSQ